MNPDDVYFDSGTNSGAYWHRMPNGRFIRLSEANLKMHAISAGIRCQGEPYELTQFDEILLDAQRSRAVEYAGPLAGYRIGFHNLGGRSVLVTSESAAFERWAKLDGPCSVKDWPWIGKVFSQLFNGESAVHALSWCHHALSSLLRGDMKPGTMLGLCGPAQCGKSFFQVLVTELLGGRTTDPYQYMVGRTAFNGDVAACEHLSMEDRAAHRDIQSRRAFGSALKELSVNSVLRVHEKGRCAVSVPTFRRLTMSLNNEPENLAVLPPMEPSISDKIHLISCRMVSSSVLGSDYKKNIEKLRKEIPAFGRMLLTQFETPPDLHCARFGCKAFHDPELMDCLKEQEPQTRLLQLIDAILWETPFTTIGEFKELHGDGWTPANGWRGTAFDLERVMRGSNLSTQADRLLPGASTIGTYLLRVAVQSPERCRKRRCQGKVFWEILRPALELP